MLSKNSYIVILLICGIHGLQKVLIADRIEEKWAHPKYANFNVWFQKTKNMTVYGHLNITLHKDFSGKDFKMYAKLYKWSDNQYKPTAAIFSKPLCDYLDKELRMFFIVVDGNLFKNFIRSCPLKKGSYYIKDFPLSNFPANLFPPWKMKVYFEINDMVQSLRVLNMTALVEIQDVF